MNEQTALTASERSILERHEAVIKEGLQTFAEVGNALLAIRDGRLYRDAYGTFDAYCKERWGFSANRARRLIGAAEVAANLESVPMGTKPDSERQARPLSALSPEDQPAAWTAATEKAKADNRPVTARDVQAEVDRVRQAAIDAEEKRYFEKEQEQEETEVETEPPKQKRPGVGVRLSNDAIAILQKIPIDDPLRHIGLQTVAQWIKANK